MNNVACQYVIVRFAPFIEMGEFANVGIIMIAPKKCFFGFKLEINSYSRVTNFFDKIDANTYENALCNFKTEMNRVSKTLKQESHNQLFITNMFKEIIRTRETIIRFSQVRTVLTNNPSEQLKKLFTSYVERSHSRKKNQETLLEKNVLKLLLKADTGSHFSDGVIGDDSYHAVFPFIKKSNNIEKIIKPLYLGQNSPTKIQNHGAVWIFKINTLKKNDYLQAKNVLFVLSPPANSTGKKFDAYHKIKSALIETGVLVTIFNQDNDHILEFAQNNTFNKH